MSEPNEFDFPDYGGGDNNPDPSNPNFPDQPFPTSSDGPQAPNPNISGMFGPFGPGENPQRFDGIFGGTGRENGDDFFQSLLQALTGKGAQAAGAGIGIGTGLAGLIQALINGGNPNTSTVKHNVSPQERQLTGETLQTLQRLRALAGNQEINNAVNSLAKGQLPISPDLIKQVTAAFGATAGGLAQNAIENARQRGFSGGTDLLPGAGSPQYSQSLAQLQSDVSSALVNLALGLPTAASNINAQQGGILGGAIGQQNDLLRALQSQNQTQQRTSNGNSIFAALEPFSRVLGGTGGYLAGANAFNQPRQQQQPISPFAQPNTNLSGYNPNA